MFVRLNEDQGTALLAVGGTARLGCIVDGGPYIVPINYYFADGCVYSHSLVGLKITALRLNPVACVQVDHVEGTFCWQSALAFGRFEEITDPEERTQVLNNLLRQFAMLTPVESAVVEDAGPLSVIAFRIRIERVTAVGEE